MKKYDLVSVIALFVFIIALPAYAALEPLRMQRSQANLRQQMVSEGSRLYVELCARCHGASGEGRGVMPGLSNPALADADHSFLFKTIARASHGTTMEAWHVDEGGILNDYQIDELVTVIRYAKWPEVGELAQELGFTPPPAPADETGLAYLQSEGDPEPHQCVSCHEEPGMHAGQFGINCARCHSTLAWAPAQLTRHDFLLDHGGEGTVACETCHVANYYEHTCNECHDHQPDEMRQVHFDLAIIDYESCADCHPTGLKGEAEKLLDGQVEQKSSFVNFRPLAQDLAGK